MQRIAVGRIGRTVVVVMAVVGLAAACAGSGSGDGAAPEASDGTGSPTAGPAGDGSTADGRWLGLLALVPDTEGTRHQTELTDLVAAAEAVGIDRPSADASDSEIADYFVALDGAGRDGVRTMVVSLALADRAAKAARADSEFRDELGWSLTQIDRAVRSGEPPDTLWGVEGTFDPAAIDEVLGSVPYWSGIQEQVDHGPGSYYRWGDDLANDLRHVSVARPLGVGARMVVTDEQVVVTSTDAMAEGAIDAMAGGPSLATDPDAAAAVAPLEDEPVFAVALVGDASALTAGVSGTVPDSALTGVRMVAAGWGLDGDQPVCLLVVVADDESAARANEERFRSTVAEGRSLRTEQPFSESVTVAGSEVDGRVTVFTLDVEQPTFVQQSLVSRDGLVVAGP